MKSFLFLTLVFLVPAMVAHAADVKEVAPGDAPKGKVCEWKSADGLAFRFIIPRSYDEKKGANLVFLLHGSNLTRAWGFANHKAGTFRPDDIVVSPDGTTSNGKGGFNFLGKDEDVTRFEALQEELMASFKINATFLYGHSQGSFFALHYAGARPEAVQGVLAHASGVWTWTVRSSRSHHQAIVFMHGTQDPVVPYGQSAGGFQVFKDGGYPHVRLRSLEGWNHWPAENNGPIPHASQQLAWIEGITTDDPARLAEVFRTFGNAKDKSQHDFAAFHDVAGRMQGLDGLSDGARKAADRVVGNVEALTQKHADAFDDVPPEVSLENDSPSWIGHLPMFLRNFKGLPAAVALEKEWEASLEQHKKAASEHLGSYYTKLREGNEKEAFAAGLEALSLAFLTTGTASSSFLKKMEEMADSAVNLGIDRAEARRAKTILRNYRKALENGRRAFETINKRGAL